MSEEIHVAKDSQGNDGFYDPISKQAYINGILYKIFTIEGEGINGCHIISQSCTPHTKDLVLDYILVDDVRYNVLCIADKAFSGCRTIESVVLGDSVGEIGDMAFEFCTGLKRFVSGSGIEVIPDGCFMDACNLRDVQLGNNITQILDGGFNCCGSIRHITLPEKLNHIGEEAFNGCASLEKITLPENVHTIPHSAFVYCGSLEELTIGASERLNICGDALSWCNRLKRVYSNVPKEKIKVFDCKKSVGLSGPTHHKKGTYPWDYQSATFIYTGKDTGEEEYGIAYEANGNE